MIHLPKLMTVATAVPPHILLQQDAASAGDRSFSARIDDFPRLSGVFRSAGITKRNRARPLEWYLEPRGWREATAVYLESATNLFVDAANAALKSAGLNAQDVDTVVTISSTGIATPSIEARVAAEKSH